MCMKLRPFIFLVLFLVIPSLVSFSQSETPIQTSVPFLRITPSATSGAMGEIGVATPSDDPTSIYWNIAKIAQAQNTTSLESSVTPWLRNLGVDDVTLFNLSGYHKLSQEQGIGFSLRYFRLGELPVVGNSLDAEPSAVITPYQMAVDVGYSRMLSKSFSMGITTKFVRSDITQGQNDTQAGNTFAVDIGALYQKFMSVASKGLLFSVGGSISNVGAKISYSTSSKQQYIPTNLSIGVNGEYPFSEKSTVSLGYQFSKLLVPSDAVTSNDGVFASIVNSFGDAAGGFSEELREVTHGVGLEYTYFKTLSVRTGYFYENENKGGRRFITTGAGVNVRNFNFALSYIISTALYTPYGNTLRFSLKYTIPGVHFKERTYKAKSSS